MHTLDVRLGSAEDGAAPLTDGPLEFVALQPVGIVDHLCAVDEPTLKSVLQGCAAAPYSMIIPQHEA